jgi:hypothetical protein
MAQPKKVRGRVEPTKVRPAAVVERGHSRPQPDCVCGASTYRLNAEFAELCTRCDEPSFMCDCPPLDKVAVLGSHMRTVT